MATRTRLIVSGMLLAGCVSMAGSSRADVTGSFDGALSGKKLPQSISVALAVSQSGKALSGTVALPADLAVFGGAYLVHGSATPKQLKLSGGGGAGAVFAWRAKIVGDTVRGKARLKGPGGKLAGTLAMTRNVSSSDGSGCDPVFNQNQMFFVDQVLGQALTGCTACHAPGLQAQATRLHVLRTDPLATARAVAPLVDSANPSASRILQKPLNVLPHGGGPQLVAGSGPEQLLRQWVDLIAQAHCN